MPLVVDEEATRAAAAAADEDGIFSSQGEPNEQSTSAEASADGGEQSGQGATSGHSVFVTPNTARNKRKAVRGSSKDYALLVDFGGTECSKFAHGEQLSVLSSDEESHEQQRSIRGANGAGSSSNGAYGHGSGGGASGGSGSGNSGGGEPWRQC
jgi:hypothetical protein